MSTRVTGTWLQLPMIGTDSVIDDLPAGSQRHGARALDELIGGMPSFLLVMGCVH